MTPAGKMGNVIISLQYPQRQTQCPDRTAQPTAGAYNALGFYFQIPLLRFVLGHILDLIYEVLVRRKMLKQMQKIGSGLNMQQQAAPCLHGRMFRSHQTCFDRRNHGSSLTSNRHKTAKMWTRRSRALELNRKQLRLRGSAVESRTSAGADAEATPCFSSPLISRVED